MPKKNGEVIYSSLEYGSYKVDVHNYNREDFGKDYDLVDEIGFDILDYRIKRIKYILNKTESMDKIYFEFINKKDNTTKILETPTWEGLTNKENEYILGDDETINTVKIYMKGIKLVGFEIFTNKGNNKKIGMCKEKYAIIEDDLKNGGKQIVGFGFIASKRYGVYCMRFYYINRY